MYSLHYSSATISNFEYCLLGILSGEQKKAKTLQTLQFFLKNIVSRTNSSILYLKPPLALKRFLKILKIPLKFICTYASFP